MDYVSKGAGAVLGYIAGDVPGAIAGYEFGDRAYKWSRGTGKSLSKMSNPFVTPDSTVRGRKRQRGSGSAYSRSSSRSGGRVPSLKFSRSRSRKRSSSRARVVKGGVSKVSVRDPEVFQGKRVNNKKTKKLKISKKFRKMVKQASAEYLPKGSYMSTHFGHFNVSKEDVFENTSNRLEPFGVLYNPPITPLTAVVSCRQFLYGQLNADGYAACSAFSLWEMLVHHSLIWYNLTKRMATRKSSQPAIAEYMDGLGVAVEATTGDTATYGYRIADVLNPMLQVPFEVINAYRTYTLRNNSTRTLKLTIYDGVPKVTMVPGRTLFGDWNNNYNTKTGLASGMDNRDQVRLGQDYGFPELVDPFNHGPNGLYQTPEMYPELLKSWKIGKKTVVLEPGQTYVHKVQGPKNLKIHPRSYYQGGTIFKSRNVAQPILQTSGYDWPLMNQYRPGIGCSTIFAVTPDLVNYQNIGAIIPLNEDPAVSAKFGITVKMTKYFSSRMPDQAGFDKTTELSGNAEVIIDTQMLNKRKPMMYRAVWDRINNAVIDETLIDRIDAQNPQTVQTDS